MLSASNGSRVRARASIDVMLRPEIADPQGQTIERSMPELGWENVSSIRIGKHIELALEGESLERLNDQVREMCETLLANPVIEGYTFTVEESAPHGHQTGGVRGGESARPERPR